MGVAFQCGQCGKSFDVGYEVAGKAGRCKRCGAVFTIPLASTSIPVAPRSVPPPPIPRARTAPASRSRPADPAAVPPPRPRASAPPSQPSAPATTPPSLPRDYDDESDVPLPPRADVRDPVRRVRRPDRGAREGDLPAARIAGGLLTACLAVAGGYFTLERQGWIPRDNVIAQVAGSVQDAVAQVATSTALPHFADLGDGVEVEPGVKLHTISLGPANPRVGAAPGHSGKLWVYLPSGSDGATRSLPCILAPAMGTMITGALLTLKDRRDHVMYARAGFAVVAFELDGAVNDAQVRVSPEVAGRPELDQAFFRDREVKDSMTQFRAAKAGMVNARIALEYALQKVPAVDPGRISIVGTITAGTLAVLFAENEPRLKSAVAYSPVIDTENTFGPVHSASIRREGFDDFLTRYSPKAKAAGLRCALYVAHVRNMTLAQLTTDLEAFAEQAKAAGKEVTLDMHDIPPGGDLLHSFLIPRAIAWLKGEPLPEFTANLAARRNPPGILPPPRGVMGPPPGMMAAPAMTPDATQARTQNRLEEMRKRTEQFRQGRMMQRGGRPGP